MTELTAWMFWSIAILGVLEAFKLLMLVPPPMAPLKAMVPAPAVMMNALVPAELLSTVLSVILPPAEFRVVSPVRMVAPSTIGLPLELMTGSSVVVLAVLVRPPLKLKVPPLPSVTPLVLLKVSPFVTVFVLPFMITS